MKITLPVKSERPHERSRRQWLGVAGLALVAILTLWMIASQFWGDLSLAGKQPSLSPAAFEAETGIRVTLIAVTGGGGFVDFRIKVLDVEKAARLFANPENRPILIVEEDGTELLPPPEVAFDSDLEANRGHFLLYANSGGIVKRGSPVTVVIGDYRLEPIDAQ